ncbi:MAG: hypothetical protein IT450_17460 [Phycisphaerales bacterium]|nr:hypothetical protein [Phycisphaerales bacterium]
MSNLAQEPPPPSSVGDDVLCLGCGYMLRGLNPAGACPECGQPIAQSLGPANLCDLDSQWLRRVRRGLRVVAGGLLLFIIVPLAVFSAVINVGLAAKLLIPALLAPMAVVGLGAILCCLNAATTDQIAVIRRARRYLQITTIVLATTIGAALGLFGARGMRSDALLASLGIVLLVETAVACHAYSKWLRVLFDRRGTNDPREPWIAPEMATFALITPITVIMGPPFFFLSFLMLVVGYTFLLFATGRVISLLSRAIAHREAR